MQTLHWRDANPSCCLRALNSRSSSSTSLFSSWCCPVHCVFLSWRAPILSWWDLSQSVKKQPLPVCPYTMEFTPCFRSSLGLPRLHGENKNKGCFETKQPPPCSTSQAPHLFWFCIRVLLGFPYQSLWRLGFECDAILWGCNESSRRSRWWPRIYVVHFWLCTF